MNRTAQVGLIVVVLAVVVAFAIYCYNRRPNPRPSRMLQSARKTVTTPMWWDKTEGAYMVRLNVGRGSVEFVFDTGSSQLSAKGEGCQWTTCSDGNKCKTRACPCGPGRRNCSDHYYQPAGEALQPGERGAGMSTLLIYGSQSDTVSHWWDSVSIPDVNVTCTGLKGGYKSRGDGQPVEMGQMVVHKVSHISGTSSSNLLGMAKPNGGTVLDSFFSGGPCCWSMAIKPKGGWLALGPMPCFPSPKYVPLVTPRDFSGYVTQFYIVPIREVMVGPSQTSLIRVKNVPKYCLLDTGTTLTYGPVWFGQSLHRAGYQGRTSHFQITLGDKKNSVTLTYTADQIRDPDYPDSSVLQVDEGRTLDDFDQLFPGGSALLFGVLMMRNLYWEFDVANSRLGVQAFD